MNKFNALHKILELTEYIKLEADKNRKHHQLKNHMIKSSRRILFQLSTNGPINQRTLAKQLTLSPQAISEAVKKLEVDSFITKDILTNETVIKLTPKGEQKSMLIKEHIQKHSESLFESFNEEELELFIKLTNKIMKKENN